MKLNKTKSTLLFILTLILIVASGYVSAIGIGKTGTGAAKNIILGLDLKGGVSVTYKVTNEDFTKEELEDTKYKLERRVAQFSTESEVYTEGEDKITVDIPGVYDSQKVIDELGKPGSLMFVTTAEEGYEGTDEYPLYTAKDGTNYKVWVNGNEIANAKAQAMTDQTTNASSYVVALSMTDVGAKKFAEATRVNLDKTISILYDDVVVSAPTVNSVISDGEAVIEGQASMEEAEKLASTIRIGSLSLDLEKISSKVVSAKLGNDAIETSLLAGLIGLLIIMVFMIIVYRVPGVVASIALTLYTIMELLVLNGFDLTLTLPGIAGIILSIGMAVDANVIIYARIKEELATGKSTESAIKIGFKKATSAIVDGNVTTFIASLVLMWKGTGPVQGFAITLCVGIILSMITSMVVSRVLMYCLYSMGVKDKKFYGVQKQRKTIDFLKNKVIWFVISILLVGVGFVFMGINASSDKGAFNYSIEFVGGTATTVEFSEDYSVDDFNDNIKPKLADAIGSNDIQGQKETGSNKFVIKTKTLTDEERTALHKVLKEDFKAVLPEGETDFEESTISSSVSEKMKEDAIISVVLATICMLIYIWFRFKNLRFAGSAVLALVHDVLVVVGFYAISRTTVGTTFIACMLTIVGYSINATIVIFDRIREKLAEQNSKKVDVKEVVNSSITQTLTRSIYTSFTTFVMVAVLYVLGVTSVKEFALPIMVGIVAGGYSSVFVTGSLWYVMSKGKYGKKKKEVK
ncbi:MAG: protein translocase subunit SecD [Lachnospiraceae bacterium]|nr:protein translocase subunit SecD [Lachnospiraceae bacterium]